MVRCISSVAYPGASALSRAEFRSHHRAQRCAHEQAPPPQARLLFLIVALNAVSSSLACASNSDCPNNQFCYGMSWEDSGDCSDKKVFGSDCGGLFVAANSECASGLCISKGPGMTSACCQGSIKDDPICAKSVEGGGWSPYITCPASQSYKCTDTNPTAAIAAGDVIAARPPITSAAGKSSSSSGAAATCAWAASFAVAAAVAAAALRPQPRLPATRRSASRIGHVRARTLWVQAW